MYVKKFKNEIITKTKKLGFFTLLNIGFMSVYQLGRAGRENGGGGTYNLDTENH